MKLGRLAARAGLLAIVAASTAPGLGRACPSDEAPPGGGPADPADSRRVPWTASRIAGTPDPPPPYRAEPAFPALKFEQPVVLTSTPSIGRIFVAEVGGKVYSFPNDPACARADLAIDLRRARPDSGQLFGMAFHPDFARNRRVYLCYTTRRGGPDGTRVSKFEVGRADPPRIDPATEAVLLTWQAGGHNAGCLAFGPDGFLYIAAGDTADPTPPDPLDTGQDIGDIPSSILRIDVDHAEAGRPYRVPPDNPFTRTPGARPEVWAFGFRNPWRMSFDRGSGDLWVGDVGWELWEMIHRVERGGNYGWSIVEGPQPVKPGGRRGPGPIRPPVVSHPHSEAGSITGGYVYRGRKLPELAGVYVYGDFQSGKVWGLRHDGGRVTWRRELADTPIQLVSFGEDNEGEVYALDYERSKQVYKFVPNRAASTASTFPRALSETGLFANTAAHTPAPGVVPYAINAELWEDDAKADRLVAVPGRGSIVAGESGRWKVPEGTVLARTVSIEMERGRPATRRRLETQVLHFEDGTWRPYTYLWNDGQTDATLADPKGSSRTLTIRDDRAPGGVRTEVYRSYARSECVLCHNPWVEKQTTMFGRQTASPLAFRAEQLDRDARAGHSPVNQLAALRASGLLAGPSAADPKAARKLADPYDPTAPLDARARAYLQVNCAHCHQFGAGGSANIVLQAAAPLDQTKTVGARPMQGGFGIDDARIIAPGDPEGSVLYYRMAKQGGGRMPRVGSDSVDVRGVALIRDWIAGMPGPSAGPADGRGSEAIRRLMDSPRGGLSLMRLLDRKALDPSGRALALALAKDCPKPEVRDLLERFLPESDRARRLGDRIEPAAILALRGDAGRGGRLFAASTTQCINCHKVGKAGVELGPALDAIGSKYDRATMLRHILEPSLEVEPRYLGYVVETKSGTVHSGLMVERNDREVVLKDPKNETIRVPAADVEQVRVQPKSTMPEALLRDLDAQQAADLLEYLGSLKGPGR